jgi:hypothetical protein
MNTDLDALLTFLAASGRPGNLPKKIGFCS